MDRTYEDRVMEITLNGQVSLIMGIAREIGIFDTLKTAEKPLTSQEVADSKRLKERYVREILDCLTAAELVHVSTNKEGKNAYFLDQEEKECLKSFPLPITSFTLVLARAAENVLPCMHVDGPYASRYDERTFKFLDDVKLYTRYTIVDTILKFVPELKERLENGVNVIEFGSGSGRILALFAEMFPKSRFLATEVVARRIEEMKSLWGDLPNMSFEYCDLSALPDSFVESFDWGLALDVIHDLPNPPESVKDIKRCLKKPNGLFTFWDKFGSDSRNMRTAAQCASSTLLCIPESFQRIDSLAYGSSWRKQIAIDMVTTAGYRVQAFDIEAEALIVCHLDEEKA